MFCYLGSAETEAFDISLSFSVLSMIIIGGLGSILGSLLGAAFITMMPIFLTNAPPLIGLSMPIDLQKHIEVILFGSLLIVDLRLLGRGMTNQPVAKVARDARPWLIGALICMVLTGIAYGLSVPVKEYYSPFFWLKMRLLLFTLIFTFTLRHKVTMADEARVGPVWGKVVGLTSIALWTWVAVEGRLIGLLS